MAQVHAVVFDAHGTLPDVPAAMARHAGRVGANWFQISTEWREKQPEYSCVRGLAGPEQHRDLCRLTEDALAWTAARLGVDDAAVLADLLMEYRSLDSYPEVPPVLRRIGEWGLPRAILSNGEPGTLADATRSAGIDYLLDFYINIETIGIFKPSPPRYRLAEQRPGLAGGQIAFVSSNPWDAFGGLAFGVQVFWINRAGLPDEYGLKQMAIEMSDLPALPGVLDAGGLGARGPG